MYQMKADIRMQKCGFFYENPTETGLAIKGLIVEMPWGGTWKSSIAAFLFLFLLLGVILTRNPLDASLASLINFFCSHFKNYLSGHKLLHF